MLLNEYNRPVALMGLSEGGTTATAETATKFLMSTGELDVRDIANDVQVPAMVLHRKGDLVIPAKYGQDVAAQLPNAQMVLLEGNNHWMVSVDEDMEYVVGLIEDFVLPEHKS